MFFSANIFFLGNYIYKVKDDSLDTKQKKDYLGFLKGFVMIPFITIFFIPLYSIEDYYTFYEVIGILISILILNTLFYFWKKEKNQQTLKIRIIILKLRDERGMLVKALEEKTERNYKKLNKLRRSWGEKLTEEEYRMKQIEYRDLINRLDELKEIFSYDLRSGNIDLDCIK
jgi:hypothetical protein